MSKEAKYIKIKDDIIESINNGVYKENDKLPSESELTEKYDVSRHTIRAALTLLEFEKVIVKEQGLGSFVRKKSTNNIKTVGVITTYLSEYIFPTINRGIEKVLSENGFSMLLASTNNNIEMERRAIEMMLEKGVGGLIVEPTKSAFFNPNIELYLKIKRMGIPVLMINAQYDELDFPFIAINDYKSSYTATRYLVDNNHENIGAIFKSDDKQGRERLRGFVKACQDYGIDYNSSNVVMFNTENQMEFIEKEVKKILKNKNITALVCYNDTVALDVLNICWRSNVKVPEELSLVSFDNSILSTISEVKITSINHPKINLGKDAAKEMIKMINNINYKGKNIIYPVDLDIKESVQKL